MSDAVSEGGVPRGASETEQGVAGALVERDDTETMMTYGDGGFPKIVALVWVVALAGLAWYMVSYGFADLARWRGR